LVELLGNLLDNAHRFAASRVSVKAKVGGDGLWVRICDDGPGFKDPGLATAVERLRDPERTRGLGVAIAQEIVEAYGGRLIFRPRKAGDGLVVELTMP